MNIVHLLHLCSITEHGYRRDRQHPRQLGCITLNTRAERGKLLNKNTRTRIDTQMIGTKKNTFQLELKNRFTALEEHGVMDSLNKKND